MNFDIMAYLKGRKEYLRAISVIFPSDSQKSRCAQARLSEVQDLLFILDQEVIDAN